MPSTTPKTMSGTMPSTMSSTRTMHTPRARWLRSGVIVMLFATFTLAACGGDDSNDETEQAGDTDQTTGASDDNGDDNGNDNGNGDGDCGDIGIPDEFASFFNGTGCDFVECIFDELDVSNPDEFEEKFSNDGAQPTPDQIGDFSRAIAACGSTLDTSA